LKYSYNFCHDRYRNGEKMEVDLIKIRLKKILNEKRWKHSVNTSQLAYKLAKRYGIDLQKARIAGLLHDCAKDMSFEKLKKLAISHRLKFDIEIEKIPKVLHAFTGALIAREQFGIQDPEILQAIRLHSTGGKNMTDLDKIIYLSDKIEPSRYFNEIEKVRDISIKDLDKAILILLDKGLISLIKRGLLIYPATIEARNEVLNKVVLLNA